MPAHRHDLAGRKPSMERRGVAVVARRPVARADLVAEVGAARLATDAHEPPGRRLDLVAGAVHRRRDDRLHVVRARDVGLVVAAQVAQLPLVEEDDARERREPRGRQRAGRLPRGGVGRVVEEGRELDLRPRDELERRLGHDPERALVAHEQVLELVAGRGLADLPTAAVADLDDLAGRQHDLEADDEVAGVAVSATDERPAAGADASADERARIATPDRRGTSRRASAAPR